ncbi:MAG: hypothetical protein PVG14_15860 [Anaerolineales bacterium]
MNDFQSLQGQVAVEYKTAAATEAAAGVSTAAALEKMSAPYNIRLL